VNVVKLFAFDFVEDFGEEFYFDFLVFKRFIALSVTAYRDVYAGQACFEFVLGLGQLASILVSVANFTLKIQLFAKRY
jgi:hypothetical protein